MKSVSKVRYGYNVAEIKQIGSLYCIDVINSFTNERQPVLGLFPTEHYARRKIDDLIEEFFKSSKSLA